VGYDIAKGVGRRRSGRRLIRMSTADTVNDRRANCRRAVRIRARVAASPEQRLPRCEAVDISLGGLLLAFAEPVGFPVGHRLVISLDLPDGHFHALGRVARVDRGDDFRTYVAMSFMHVRPEDFDELMEQVNSVERAPEWPATE
jgi:hypothetical protein